MGDTELRVTNILAHKKFEKINSKVQWMLIYSTYQRDYTLTLPVQKVYSKIIGVQKSKDNFVQTRRF
jgi:hypothetical protein